MSRPLADDLGVEGLTRYLLRVVVERSGGQRALLVSADRTTVRGEAWAAGALPGASCPRPLRETDASVPRLEEAARTKAATGEGEGYCLPLVQRGRVEGFVYVTDGGGADAASKGAGAFLRAFLAHAASALAAASLRVELDGSEARHRFLFDSIPLAIMQLDTSGYRPFFAAIAARGESVEEWVRHAPDLVERLTPLILGRVANPACAELFGVDAPESFFRPFGGVWHAAPTAREAGLVLRRSLLARFAGKREHIERTKLMTVDGRIVDVLYIIRFRDESDTTSALDVVSFVDLTDLVAAERMLEKLEAEFAHGARVSMLGELAASLAHELRQPLAGISANAGAARRWLDGEPPETTEAAAAVQRIGSDARRAGEVLARISAMATNAPPRRTDCSMHEIIDEAVQLLQAEVRTRGVTLATELPAVPVWVNVDRVQIHQIVVNLAINAMQAVARGPSTGKQVTIELRTDETMARITVVDSGPGFPPADSGRLFDSFYSTREHGMGMGLRIARTLVEAHHGTIEASNRAAGGAAFGFTLPLVGDA